MKVKDIMTNPAISVSGEDTVCEAARIMQAHNIGSIPVVNGKGQVVGIVTDREIAVRNTSKGEDSCGTKIREMMTTHVDTKSPNQDVKDVIRRMSNDKVRRLPVVDAGVLIGMLTIGDVSTLDAFKIEAAEALAEISENE